MGCDFFLQSHRSLLCLPRKSEKRTSPEGTRQGSASSAGPSSQFAAAAAPVMPCPLSMIDPRWLRISLSLLPVLLLLLLLLLWCSVLLLLLPYSRCWPRTRMMMMFLHAILWFHAAPWHPLPCCPGIPSRRRVLGGRRPRPLTRRVPAQLGSACPATPLTAAR